MRGGQDENERERLRIVRESVLVMGTTFVPKSPIRDGHTRKTDFGKRLVHSCQTDVGHAIGLVPERPAVGNYSAFRRRLVSWTP